MSSARVAAAGAAEDWAQGKGKAWNESVHRIVSLPSKDAKRPIPPGEEALYKYPMRPAGYHPLWGSGGVETPANLMRSSSMASERASERRPDARAKPAACERLAQRHARARPFTARTRAISHANHPASSARPLAGRRVAASRGGGASRTAENGPLQREETGRWSGGRAVVGDPEPQEVAPWWEQAEQAQA